MKQVQSIEIEEEHITVKINPKKTHRYNVADISHKEWTYKYNDDLEFVEAIRRVIERSRKHQYDLPENVTCPPGCAECCSGYEPFVNREDVARMASHFGMTFDEFMDEYVVKRESADGFTVGWLRKVDEKGERSEDAVHKCVFLMGNKSGRHYCGIYDVRPFVGGACVSEETFPGFKVSTAAYVNSLFRPEIVRDLRLRDYGFELIERNPSSFSPFPDGRYLMLGADEALNRREIAKFSPRDADAYPKYVAMLERVAAVIEPTLLQTPPNPVRPGIGDLLALGKLGLSVKGLDGSMGEAVEILTGAARPILDRWFECEQLKATLATDAIIGAFASPSMPGTAYVLFHHVTGETNGARGVWSYVKGGMGGLTQALAKAASDLGVEIRTEAEVVRILTHGNAVSGVALASGEEFHAKSVASNVDAHITFTKLMDPRTLPP